jgi:site-specific DNA-cytosine methylase
LTSAPPEASSFENVAGLARQHKKCLKEIIALLKMCGGTGYYVEFKILNSRHYGTPQNRERVYIVGQRRDCVMQKFTWPEEDEPSTALAAILVDPAEVDEDTKKGGWTPRMLGFIDEAEKKMAKQGVDVHTSPCSIDIMRSPKFGLSVTHNYSQCLTRTRAASGGFFVTSVGRMLDIKEMMKLQGFNERQWDYQARSLVASG